LVLTNARLGTRTALDPQCHVDALGSPWVLLGCPAASNSSGQYEIELYSVVDGTHQTVTPSPGVPLCHSPANVYAEIKCASEPDGVGAHWIRWDATCYNSGDTYLFQDIKTGEVRDDPTNATTFADLNSPALARSTCPGVRLIRNANPDGGLGWGSLTPYGEFVLATGDGSAFLERCGTRMRQRLVHGFFPVLASNSRAVVWQAQPRRLSGLFLPSFQTFTVPLPSAIAKQGMVLALMLSSRALYVKDGYYGRFWRTAGPAAVPLDASRPSVTRFWQHLHVQAEDLAPR
jgi:hypothetical protein